QIALQVFGNHVDSTQTILTPVIPAITTEANVDTPPINSGSSTFNSITVTPSLGKIFNAKVTLRNAKNKAILGTANTGNLGKVNFQIKKDIQDIVVEVEGGATAKYFDEETGEQPLPASVMLRVAAPVVNKANIGVSVFTEAAVKHAEKLTDGLTKSANIIEANKKIGEAVGVSNILQAPVLIGSNNDYNNLKDDAASAYALQLAGLVKDAAKKVPATVTTPALSLLNILSDDLSDGIVDGKKEAAQLSNLPYAALASVFAARWQLAMQEVIANLANINLKTTLKAKVIDKVEIKDINVGTVVTGDTDFGGGDKAAWKGEIYLLATNTPKLPDFNTLTPIGTLFTDQINIPLRSFTEPFPGVPSDRFEWFGVRYQGPLTISESGSYRFETVSDDGSKLFIDDVLVVD
ncbi:MAG: hypothetical protein KDI39_19180, partial [Pseudomonadales bacterium]|nr:hypothetical protein [Pseudomonadales bacterium]